MALTKISTGGFKDDAASQAKIADEAVDEARLQVSNAGTNGQFLSKQSGNTGGLTWADAITAIADDSITQSKIADDAIGQDQLAENAVVLANLTNDCVTADKIADEAIAESRLEISNAGTNGQFLQKQSGNTGGLTWADAGGGAWEVVSTHVLTGSTSDIQMYGWSNTYAQYKIVFSGCYNADQNLMRIRFYTDSTSGNNGTIVTASTYKRTGYKFTFGSTSSPGIDAGESSYFYPQVASMGTESNDGELMFPMKTSNHSAGHKCYGHWLGHADYWGNVTCEMDSNLTHFLTGIHIYFTEDTSTTAKAPTSGRVTLLRMKTS